MKRVRQRTYWTWHSMKKRCYLPTTKSFLSYGGRGITVCQRWLDSYKNFLADMGLKPEGMSLDRIDNDGNYEPSNCRWATRSQQQANKTNTVLITFRGETFPRSVWEKKLGLSDRALAHRLSRGWTLEEAMTTKPRKYHGRTVVVRNRAMGERA